jgi:hypothetical protein
LINTGREINAASMEPADASGAANPGLPWGQEPLSKAGCLPALGVNAAKIRNPLMV